MLVFFSVSLLNVNCNDLYDIPMNEIITLNCSWLSNNHNEIFSLICSQVFVETQFATTEQNSCWMSTSLGLLTFRRLEFKKHRLNYPEEAFLEGNFMSSKKLYIGLYTKVKLIKVKQI